jgi:hypothetical protein
MLVCVDFESGVCKALVSLLQDVREYFGSAFLSLLLLAGFLDDSTHTFELRAGLDVAHISD